MNEELEKKLWSLAETIVARSKTRGHSECLRAAERVAKKEGVSFELLRNRVVAVRHGEV